MPRKPGVISKEYYAQWVNTFLLEGQNFNRVATKMGCSFERAKRVWREGFVKNAEWARPIYLVYQERVKTGDFSPVGPEDPGMVTEVPSTQLNSGDSTPHGNKVSGDSKPLETLDPIYPASTGRDPAVGTDFASGGVGTVNAKDRAPPIKAEMVRVMGEGEITRMLNRAMDRVKANIATALLAEQDMIGTARNNLSGILVLSDKLLAGLMPLVDTVVERLRTMASDANQDPNKVLKLIDRVIKINAATVTAGAKVLEMQRLMTGMPQTIHEQRTTERPAAQDAPTDEARAELAERLERAKRAVLAAADPLPVGESKLPEVEEPPLDEDDTDE